MFRLPGTGYWGAFRFRKPTPTFSTEPNIDGIYSAAFATEYYVDAADAFYPYAKGVVEEFIDAPEANYKKMYSVVRLYDRMVSGCYTSCGDIYSSLDKVWVSQFWNAVTNSSGRAQTINSCKSMASMLKDYFSHEYAGFVGALAEE